MSRLSTFSLSLAALLLLVPSLASADPRPREVMSAAGLELALEKLRVVGSALYVGAHPDDENTALLSYLSSGRKVRTAYLSLTRGDGGQNLIGPETGELLGVIRTQELLAARRVDGAEQFFTRALDFGFSKNAAETMAFWGHDAILSDVVSVIRRFRPDVIIDRFPPDSTAGHGHHTASALLAEEAFVAAADPARFPEQIAAGLEAWQAKRIVWNVFRPQGVNPDSNLSADVGGYNPLLGRAYSEIAGESRSMHKSQGFGAPERRGTIPNAFRVRAGAPAANDLFDGVNLSWSRFQGGARVEALLARAARELRPGKPEAIVPRLLEARAAMASLGNKDPLLARKRSDLDELIRSCLGLWVEAVAVAPTASPGGTVRFTTSIVNRSSLPLTLESVRVPGAQVRAVAPPAPGATSAAPAATAPPGPELRQVALAFNRPVSGEGTFTVPAAASGRTQPYWLRERAGRGMFTVGEPSLIGQAETAPLIEAEFQVRLERQTLTFAVPIVYRWTDPVAGERYRALEVVPPATLRFDQGVYVFPDRAPKEVRVTVRAATAPSAGLVRLALPAGWKATPESVSVPLDGAGAEGTARFTVTPSAEPAAGAISASIEIDGVRHGSRMVQIDHPHIPMQTLFLPAEAKIVRADIRRVGENVGYVMGPGDAVPEALSQVGYKVTLLADEDLENATLSRFDAIVIGVRAFNTRPRLRVLLPRLLDYVREGGTLVAQYNTPDAALADRLGPYPFTLSRDRVTVEEAPITMIDPAHPLLARPNRIVEQDFSGWVQERGLNFPNPWDTRYETVLSSGDPGESQKAGGTLYAPLGKGVYIYTSYAWFRQLPAGVPGAYRQFVNLVSARR